MSESCISLSLSLPVRRTGYKESLPSCHEKNRPSSTTEENEERTPRGGATASRAAASSSRARVVIARPTRCAAARRVARERFGGRSTRREEGRKIIPSKDTRSTSKGNEGETLTAQTVEGASADETRAHWMPGAHLAGAAFSSFTSP